MREIFDALNRVVRVRFGVGVPKDDHVTFKIHIRAQPGNFFPDTRCFAGKDRNFPPSLIRGGHGISHDGGCVSFDRGSERVRGDLVDSERGARSGRRDNGDGTS